MYGPGASARVTLAGPALKAPGPWTAAFAPSAAGCTAAALEEVPLGIPLEGLYAVGKYQDPSLGRESWSCWRDELRT